jgi:hypothetical protein
MLVVAAGVGMVAALVIASDEGSPEGAKPRQAEQAKPEQASKQEGASDRQSASDEGSPEGAKPEQASKQGGASDRQSEAEYLGEIGNIQNGAVEASLESNAKLLRYDLLTGGDLEAMEANRTALGAYSDRVKDLEPPRGYGDQYRVFVLAINELRDANELAYRLAADPSSATQTDFEAYDRHMDRATAYLRRSNEMLGEDYKGAGAARRISLR